MTAAMTVVSDDVTAAAVGSPPGFASEGGRSRSTVVTGAAGTGDSGDAGVLATRLVGAASVQNLLRLRAGLPVGHPARAVLRERSIEAGLPLARFVAARYRGRGEPLDDLYRVAALGLVKAVDGYDAGRQAAFTSDAVPTIVGALKRHVRDSTNPLTPNGCARCTFAPASASTSTAKYQP